MKKLINTLFLLMFVCLGFSSCHDEVGIPDAGKPGNPEKEIVGSYTGTWTRTLDGVETTATGTITFTAGDKAYVANVAVECPEFGVSLSGPANVAKNSAGYTFYNQESKSNGFGTTYYGRIVDGVATINFTLSQKEGRKTYLYIYSFLGQ